MTDEGFGAPLGSGAIAASGDDPVAPDGTATAAYVIWKGLVLVGPGPLAEPVALTGPPQRPDAPHPTAAPIVPVITQGDRIVAYIVETPEEREAQAAVSAIAPGAGFREIMFELGRFASPVRRRLLRAIALERWSNRYRFCPACGTPLAWTTDAIAKICTNSDPKRVHRHFPRLDPAIIVLVTDGDRALLGRSPRFPPGFYSTLAGFVEPGESVEAALRREVYEEAGIRVGATRYFGSEPWPFPRSLMLGYFATAETTQISLRDAELEEARWFDRRELAELQERMLAARPQLYTIARRLIDTWLTAEETSPEGPGSA